MSDQKTVPEEASVTEFLDAVENEQKRQDCYDLLAIMQEITGAKPRMWGATIVGFSQYHYRYASGQEGDWFLTGFSPRKQSLSVYITSGFDRYEALMDRLGKFKTGKSCLYLKKLADVDREVLKELITNSVEYMSGQYPDTEDHR